MGIASFQGIRLFVQAYLTAQDKAVIIFEELGRFLMSQSGRHQPIFDALLAKML